MTTRPLAALLSCLLVVAAAGCHGHDDEGPGADEYFYDCEAAPSTVTTYATDESFASFVNKEAAGAVVKDDSKAPALLTPAAGATLSVATPPAFSFSVAQASAGGRGRAVRVATACPRPRKSLWPAWLSLEGTAHAHCGAITGDNYLLRVIDGGTTAYTAMLSVPSFMPSAAAWSKAMSGRSGHTVTVSVQRATFSKGDITAGPFVQAIPPTFLVGP